MLVNITPNSSSPSPNSPKTITELPPAAERAAVATQTALQMQGAATSLLPIIVRGASTTAVLLVNFVSDVLLFRFINVPFPDNFIQFCSKLYINFLPNIYLGFSEAYNISISSVGKFQTFEMSTVILGNSGNTLDREFICLCVILVTSLLIWKLKFLSKYPKVLAFVKGIRDDFRWNTLLTFYVGDFSELFLFSMVHLRENTSNSWYAWYGTILCVIFLASYLILIFYFIYILNRKVTTEKISTKVMPIEKPIAKSLQTQAKEEEGTAETSRTENQPQTSKWREVPPSINIISNDYKTNHWIQRNYLLMMMLESFINDLVIFFLQDNGICQASLYTIVTFCFLVMGIAFRPYTSKLQNFLYILNYSTKLILGIFAVYIGATDWGRNMDSAQGQLDTVGYLLIGAIVGAIIANALIALGVILSSVFKCIKARRKKSAVVPVEQKPADSRSSSVLHVDLLSPPMSISRNQSRVFLTTRAGERSASIVDLEMIETPNNRQYIGSVSRRGSIFSAQPNILSATSLHTQQ